MFGEPDRRRAVFPKEPTDADISTILELYKIALDMADKNSERRHTTNNFFLGLNTAIVTVLGYVAVRPGGVPTELFLFLAPVGVISSYLWFRLIESYRQLGTAKFAVIHELESQLPAQLYAGEWILAGEGNDPKKYTPFTHIERWIPRVFAVIHLMLVAVGNYYAASGK
jgi:hypothetical protein